MLVIDDIHNCDSFSWSFLYEITQIRNFVLIVSFGRRSNYTLHMSAKQVKISKKKITYFLFKKCLI